MLLFTILSRKIDGVFVQAIGQMAGFVAWLVAGRSRHDHLQDMAAAVLCEFVALHRLVEGKVPGGGAIPEVDAQRAAVIVAHIVDATLAAELGVVDDPVLATNRRSRH
jgi:hypothetical protein